MRKNISKNVLIIIASVVILLIGVGILAVPVTDAFFSEKTMNNLYVFNKNIGGKSRVEVEKFINDEKKSEHKITVVANKVEIPLDLNQAGITIDDKKTVDKIMSVGKKQFIMNVKSRFNNTNVEPILNVDNTTLSDTLYSVLSEKGVNLDVYNVNVNSKTADFIINSDQINIDLKELVTQIEKGYSSKKNKYTCKLKEFVWPTAEYIQKDFDCEPKDAKMTKENGKTTIVAHKIGRKINFDELKKYIENKDKKFSVAFETLNPKVFTTSLGDENFPMLLGSFTTYYSEGTVGRATNIKLATSKINGYVMNTGDIFSYNQVVGKRSAAAGFQEAHVYTGNGVENGIGGGICQVSSTLYAAVLYSNLEITHRQNHNFVVGYMKPGMDATVSYGTIDFKFKNQLANPIKIKATASGGVMSIKIYGTKTDDHTVEMVTTTLSKTPRGVKRVLNTSLPLGREVVTQSGYDGLRTNTKRIVKSSSGEIVKTQDLGNSNYIKLDKTIEYNKAGEHDVPTVAPIVPETPAVVPHPVEPTPPPAPIVPTPQPPAVHPTTPQPQPTTPEPTAPIVEKPIANETVMTP